MAKRSSKRSYSSYTPRTVRRDVATIARRSTRRSLTRSEYRLPRLVYLPPVSPILPRISDRRTHYPGPKILRPVSSARRSDVRLVPVDKGRRDAQRSGRFAGASTISVVEAGFSQPGVEVGNFDRVGFAVPKRVAVCVRRSQRREVLFAKNKQGKGSRNPVRRRNETSNVSC